MIETFVLIILFWEGSRGYAVSNVPGYPTLEACRQSANEITNPSKFGNLVGICVRGPNERR